MLSRIGHATALVAFVWSALLAGGCEKVPLLAPSGSTITLTAAATALPVNGSTDVVAQVIEAGGTPPHRGTLITFTTNLGTVQPSEAETDISGRVTVKYVAGGGSGIATVTAISGGVSASGTNAIKIAVGAAAVGGIALSASPTALPANGGTTTITAVVNDSGGNSLSGVPVTFSTDNGSLGTSVVTTDSNGRAQTTLATSRTAKVTATAGVATSSGTTTPGTPATTSSAATNSVTVTVNASATVAFGSFSPATAVAGQPVAFTLTITPSATGGVIQSVVVNFGDGHSQSLGAVSGATALSHIYDSAGTYTLTAATTDSNGDAFPAAATISVINRPPANVTISANPVAPQVGQQVAFTIVTTFPSANTALVQSVSIAFGDGNSAQLGAQTTAIAQHVYQTAGSYIATATVRDTGGGSTASQTQVIVGSRPGLVVTVTAPTSPAAGTATSFTLSATASSGASISSILVKFGDSSETAITGNATSVAHTYTTAGSYTVTATAIDTSGATGSGSVSVVVAARPGLVVTVTAPSSPVAGTSATVTLSATASSGASISKIVVNFGDSSETTITGNATSVAHTYTTAGTYTVTATATDTAGATGSGSVSVVVAARPGLVVTVTAPTSPVAGTSATVTLSATASTGASISKIVVNFGDSSETTITGNATSVAHTYTTAGTYTVTATATDTAGATGSGSASVVVAAKAQVTATIVVGSTTSGVTTFTLSQTASTGASITKVVVDFGDTTSTLSGPVTSVSHAFTSPGSYTVTITATDSTGATGTASAVASVPGGATFTVTPTGTLTRAVPAQFDASASTASSTITSYQWNFGDQTPFVTGATVSHTYGSTQNAGVYTVTLVITDSAGHTATATKQITVQ